MNVMKEAKKMRKQFPRMHWKALVKKAGKKVKSRNRQTGKSDKRADESRSARKPGKRKSSSGRTYTERRKNRTDVPGSLTGIINTGIKRQVELKLADAVIKHERATTVKATKDAQKGINKWRKILRSL